MESSAKVAASPDGNGGIYPALQNCGILDDMKARGIKYVHTYAVDNIMCKVSDPTFIGYCIAEGADCGNKVVWKAEPQEKVGVVAKKDGKSCIVEYSEMSDEQKELKDDKSKLVFPPPPILAHLYTSLSLPFSLIHTPVPHHTDTIICTPCTRPPLPTHYLFISSRSHISLSFTFFHLSLTILL
jgi:UDP-N-acetylglucosamine/UDP-N-acetylgalactosamine diphosphorylase